MTSTNQAPLTHSHCERWLLAHDICDKRRLQRVWRYLSQEGVRVQYSVYLLAGTRQQIEKILAKLRTLVDEQSDDIRVYPLTANTRIWGLGTQFVEDDNTLSDRFMDTLIVRETNAPSTSPTTSNLNFE